MFTVLHIRRSNVKLFSIERKKLVSEATLTLGDTPLGSRPKKFLLNQAAKEIHKKPSEAIDLLRNSQTIVLAKTMRASPAEAKVEKDLMEVLKAYQLTYEDVEVCRFCIGQNKFKPVDSNSIRYHDELICVSCAKQELQRELKFRGFSNFDHFCELLDKVRDLERVVRFANSGADPELTKYDVISTRAADYREIAIDELRISDPHKIQLKKCLSGLLPVQSIAVEKGLLEGKDLLVVSATATGKTLIAELAGINNILMKRGKFLFLVPLVALANQKYKEFKKRYRSLGIRTSIRVGGSKIRTKEWVRVKPDYTADIIVGTYEGIDHVLRMGKPELLGQLGTVVIDEVHLLEDEERGSRLDGLISRLRAIAPESQMIYLSATVGNPATLAKELGAALVEYEERPIPIERHLMFAKAHEKVALIDKLAKMELSHTSSKGYKGQTIVFTNSRARCHRISNSLSSRSAPYHGGMSYLERKAIEDKFVRGEIDVVVTTAALAAGVDFPASLVIFESLAMGINWLTSQEFHQMMGRAGRPDYHDIGKVMLLVEPDRRFRGSDTEDEIAISLLSKGVENVEIDYDDDKQMEQALANVALGRSVEMLAQYEPSFSLKKLKSLGFVSKDNKITKVGRVVASQFLTMKEASIIIQSVIDGISPIETALKLEVFTQVYLNNVQRYATAIGVIMSPNVFSGANLDMLFSGAGDELTYLDQTELESVVSFSIEFVNCDCKDSPFCGCPEKSFSRWLIERRMDGLEPREIVEKMSAFGVHTYSGDMLGYLDQVVRIVESIEAISKIFNKKALTLEASKIRSQIEG
jgi:helicase